MRQADIQRIQAALRDQGFNPGDIDGVWGRQTIGAVKRFQSSKNLSVDGVVGPQTRDALFGGALPPPADGTESGDIFVWLEEARHLMGTAETLGSGNNPNILKWAKNLNIDYKSDDIPWCGLFIAHCIGSTLPDEALPTLPLLARAWTKFGDLCDPKRGALLVFWRGARNGPLGHVGFYVGEDRDAYHIIGGNQSDKVSVARMGKSRLLNARWPKTARTLNSSAIIVADGGEPLSHSNIES